MSSFDEEFAELKEHERRAAVIFDGMFQFVALLNANGEILEVNRAALEGGGHEIHEIRGKPFWTARWWQVSERTQEDLRAAIRRASGGEFVRYEVEIYGAHAGAMPITVDFSLRPLRGRSGEVEYLVPEGRDITERKRVERQREQWIHELENRLSERTAELEQVSFTLLRAGQEKAKLEDQLRQTQQLETVGVLVAGVTHDLNNLLNIIQGYASVLGPEATRDEVRESIDAITETTKRGVALVQQLLALSRRKEPRKEAVDVNACIQRLGNLVKETFPKNIETVLDLDSRISRISADSNQITQVLLNLCVNARDAMPHGGRLLLKTSVVAGAALDAYGDANAKTYVCIEITDTGSGMDEKLQSRIFEPFFTTKEVGKGTGLGLSVVKEIMKNHHGLIRVDSEALRGTTFRLYFPALTAGG
jgi:PAS domain S-box-containing protein